MTFDWRSKKHSFAAKRAALTPAQRREAEKREQDELSRFLLTKGATVCETRWAAGAIESTDTVSIDYA